MQDTDNLSASISDKTPFQLEHSLICSVKELDSIRNSYERKSLINETNLEGSIIWSQKLTESLLSHKTKIYSNIKTLSKEEQKALVLPFLNRHIWINQDNSATFVSPIMTQKAYDLAYLFLYNPAIKSSPSDEMTSTSSQEEALKTVKPSYPICLSSPSVKNFMNLTNNLEKTYKKGSAFGSLEKAHLEWMENNEIRYDRVAQNQSRRLDMYRNYIYQGSSFSQRYSLIEAFLLRKDLTPIRESKGLFSSLFNEKVDRIMNTWGLWYRQGQQYAAEMINKAKKSGNIGKHMPALDSLSVLEDQTITIDWDKALHCALRSHAIAQVLGVSPKILFLTGFAALDVKQIILSQNIENIEKMIYIAQIVIKTLLKIIVIIGTNVLTSAAIGFGGLDTVTIPFGINGEAFLANHITNRVVDAIDMKFDNMKIKMDDIVDC